MNLTLEISFDGLTFEERVSIKQEARATDETDKTEDIHFCNRHLIFPMF